MGETHGKPPAATKKSQALVRRSPSVPVPASSLDQYIAEINRFKLLTREEEQELARRFIEDHDPEAAQSLVTSNLRFVVKIAYEYRNYDVKLADLIQEGNIGLMKAVRKFNPDRGYRLISYAVWWIRAYMQNYIIKNWSMVKIGTTARHRKMLFGSREAREEVLGDQSETFLLPATTALAAAGEGAAKTDVARRDFSLDAAIEQGGRSSYMELLRDPAADAEARMGQQETRAIVGGHLAKVVDDLNERERHILEARLLADEPATLQQIGDHFGVTRERARQLEVSLRKKLAKAIREFDAESPEVIDG